MATPPTFVAEYESTWTNSNFNVAKTADVTVSAGDVLVIFGVTEDNQWLLSTPTGGGLTYTLVQQVSAANYTNVYAWTAVSAGAQTFTLSITPNEASGSGLWGFNALQWSGSTGFGASNKTNVSGAAPSLGLTVTGANSAIAIGVGDWNAADGTTPLRTWRTVNGSAATEQTYFRDAAIYATYVGRHVDAGAAGAKTVGLSAPATMKYSIAAVEVLGASGTTVSDPPTRRHQLAALLDM